MARSAGMPPLVPAQRSVGSTPLWINPEPPCARTRTESLPLTNVAAAFTTAMTILLSFEK